MKFDAMIRLASIVDVIARADDDLLVRENLHKGSMTLIEADRAYLESGGSFRAVILALLTSDSFRFRAGAGD